MVQPTRWNQQLPTLLLFLLFTGLTALGLRAADERTVTGSFDIESLALTPVTQQADGMPERGQFLIIYSYEGEEIEPVISVTRNGEAIASLSQLSPVVADTLVNLNTDKGDFLNFNASFGNTQITVFLDSSFGSFPQGFWANAFSLNFFELDEEGNVVRQLGRMSIVFYLFPPFDGFVMAAEPFSIAPGEDAVLSLQAVEKPDIPVIIPANTSVNLLMSENGKRLGGYALPDFGIQGGLEGIINVPYGFITNTTLLYRASPDSSFLEGSSETVSLVTFSRFNVSINGGTAVEVRVDEEDEFEIIVTSGEEFVNPQRTGGGTSTGITVQVVKEGEPVSGFPVELTVNPVANSGGHDHHNENRPTGTLNPANGETDENGIFTATFTSSEIGGKEWIVASSPEISKKDSLKFTVKVPDLIELEESSFLVKVGAPDNNAETNDPCRPNAPTSAHFSNHWGTETLISAIQNISEEFNSIYPEVRLRINDMSLENGGVFDFRNNWNPPHRTHRTGINADIGITGIKVDGGCEWELNIDELEDIIYRVTQIDPLNEGSHLHIYTN